MDFEVKYQNWLEEDIEHSPINSSEDYFKVYSVNGKVKKKEGFRNNEINHMIYYLDNNESVENVLKRNSEISSIEIIEVETIGEYFKLMHSDYDNGQLFKTGSVSVIDKNNREIYCSSEICGEEETNKYYYDSNGKLLYTFWYYNKGSLSVVNTLNPIHRDYINPFKHDFTEEEFKKLPKVEWDKIKYYHNAEPIIPE